MRKLALIFIAAVLAPTLVLVWLAVRNLKDQQFVLERNAALLHQSHADAAVGRMSAWMELEQRELEQRVEVMLAAQDAARVAEDFDRKMLAAWRLVRVGFAVKSDGTLVSPAPGGGDRSAGFQMENERFLTSQEPVQVYFDTAPAARLAPSAADSKKQTQTDQRLEDRAGVMAKRSILETATDAPAPTPTPQPAKKETAAPPRSASGDFSDTASVPPASGVRPLARQTTPLFPTSREAGGQTLLSTVRSQVARFSQIVGEGEEGVMGRFQSDGLAVMLWYRPARARDYIFGVKLDLAALKRELATVLAAGAGSLDDICLGLLDENGEAVALTVPDFKTDWSRPFVSAEVGKILPHWEVAAALRDPQVFARAARGAAVTLWSLVGLVLAAMSTGGLLIVLDVRRQERLARQKVDFVSNVSHELKTPLTSIRMFAELLRDEAPTTDDTRRQYAGVIDAEATRLTRLINNVLDFSRLERGETRLRPAPMELNSFVRETLEPYRGHLGRNGFKFDLETCDGLLPVEGDPDALSQVVLNLVSNAEKYGGEAREISVRTTRNGTRAVVHVMDRGPGVPKEHEKRIFEKFYRVDDSLSSGIQGSGLGLTLARQIAQAHGGDVTCERREGGGSRFTISLNLKQSS